MVKIKVNFYHGFFMVVALHLFLVIFSVTFFAAERQTASLFPNKFFSSENQPTEALKSLLNYYFESPSKLESLAKIVTTTQKHWKRPNHIERWNLSKIDADERTITLFKELGLIDAIKPTNNRFDYAVILGSTVQTMRKRLAYLLDLYNHNDIRFKEIVFLVGDRKRDETEESDTILKNESNQYLINKKNCNYYMQKRPCNETEMAQMIWNQAELGDIHNLPVTFVHTPSSVVNSVHKRPTTADTVLTWKNQAHREPNSTILAISNQPDISRHDLILKQILDNCSIETVGPCKNEIQSPLFFDAIARYLYAMQTATQK
jgi:hypothetical protein